jgi:hypothetical protein
MRVRYFEAAPQFNARAITQIDVENDASHVSEIAVVCESLRGRKQQAVVADLPQQSRYAPQHCRIVIYDNY